MSATLTTDFIRQRIEAALASAWLRRCGPSGVPGDWSPLEIVEILDDELELQLSPTWTLVGESGNRSWSRMFAGKPEAEHAWCWSIRIREEEITEDEYEAMETLESACFEERGISFQAEPADSQQRPEVPEDVVHAVFVLMAGDR